MTLQEMYNLLASRGYDKNLLNKNLDYADSAYANPSGYMISQYGEDTPEMRFMDAYQPEFMPNNGFPSDVPFSSLGSAFGLPDTAAEAADVFNNMSDEELLKLLPKDDGPLFDFNIYDLIDDYEGDAASVDRHLKRNKNFRWD